MIRPLGYVTYTGPSAIDGRPIVSILTGFGRPSANPKTGPMIQQWIIRSRVVPTAAVASGGDASICGACPLRAGEDGKRRCYVNLLTANSVHRAYKAGLYVQGLPDRLPYALRFGAYGDPGALPIAHVEALAELARASGVGFTGYTHQWGERRAAGLKRYLMASVESHAGATRAHAAGWRTFRVGTDGPAAGEIVCPASAEAGHQTVCMQCRLCNGSKGEGDLRRSITIRPHGSVALTWVRGRVSEGAIHG